MNVLVSVVNGVKCTERIIRDKRRSVSEITINTVNNMKIIYRENTVHRVLRYYSLKW